MYLNIWGAEGTGFSLFLFLFPPLPPLSFCYVEIEKKGGVVLRSPVRMWRISFGTCIKNELRKYNNFSTLPQVRECENKREGGGGEGRTLIIGKGGGKHILLETPHKLDRI
ncbi:hypothetical protein, unlikely [Trypanosoma brucei gambiense DAL972]|uniref:T. brucei spp.-specific protein n=1 Tax=Trypanosoma brucei gambiense (strain MHOM/CI/86/DAL972) TaxID=679716 RepID=D0A845_TRYB9|nr:hypothetical protein, unlikely [Trypanosoma brucei gambiense DAL972]CBH17846.1 hypothetical protein, unlikely [Trypanosoma brucei gambiense DAL972]|eukprot:XP_011780110.1 hypothetical protein, unlikely [Trypanosoma brucei gambiense DAL972]